MDHGAQESTSQAELAAATEEQEVSVSNLQTEKSELSDGGDGTVPTAKPKSGILRTPNSTSRVGSTDSRVRLKTPDEADHRKSANEKARSFIHTPDRRPVNVHQFYPSLENDYQVQPGMVFYDEDTEEEEDDVQDGDGQADQSTEAIIYVQGQGQGEERPESVLTDVTVDGIVDQDIDIITAKQKRDVMSLSTVQEKQPQPEEEENENENNNENGQAGGRPSTQGAVAFDDFTASDSIFSTAVDEGTLDAARVRVQDAQVDTRTELTKVMTDKLRALYNQGLKSKSQADYGTAIRSFDKIISLKPESVLPYVQRAECYLMTADFKAAIVNYKKACCMDPNTELYYNRLAFIYYLQGQTYFDAHMYSDALECFAQASELKPDNESYHMRSIACLAALERHSECLTLVSNRLETEKANTDLYVMRSRLHMMFKNISMCYYDLKDALELDPDHAEARQIMSDFKREANSSHTSAVHLAIQGRHRDAMQKITAAIEYDPTHADYHNIRGALHRELKDFNAAVDDYLLAMDKCGHDEETEVYQNAQRQLLLTFNDFAIECFKKGHYQEAILLINKALKGEKREKGLYVNRGDCYFRTNEFQFALADYHQALEMDPTDDSVRMRVSIIHNEYGTNEYHNKNYSEAENRFSLAIRNNPRIAHYYLSRARARYMLENHGGARTDILTALHLDPTQENTISLTSRLFPGKSMDEIMASKPAMAVKNTLQHILASNGGKAKLSPLTEQQPAQKSKLSKLERVVREKHREYVEGKTEDRQLTKDKNEIQAKVRSVMKDRKSLRHTGPALALAVRAAAAADDSSPSGGAVQKTGWRTFSQGISVRDGSGLL